MTLNVNGMIQTLSTSLKPQMTFQPVKKLHNKKIYDLYMRSMNSSHHQNEYCGCGSAAEITYMGHHTGCSEFQYVHGRESYEVLLAMLKKKKKVSFPGCPFNKNKRPRLHSPNYEVPKDDDTDENPRKITKSQIVPKDI